MLRDDLLDAATGAGYAFLIGANFAKRRVRLVMNDIFDFPSKYSVRKPSVN